MANQTEEKNMENEMRKRASLTASRRNNNGNNENYESHNTSYIL